MHSARQPHRPQRLQWWTAVAACWLALGPWLAAAEAPPAAVPVFEEEVLPILRQHCLKCHGLEARKASLDLRTAGLAARGGDSGPAVAPGNMEQSLIWQRVEDGSMPPEGELPLSEAKKQAIQQWIAAGAHSRDAPDAAPTDSAPEVSDAEREFWAFQMPRRRQPPQVAGSDRAATEIDHFLLARLEEKSLSYSRRAPPHTLVRRAYLDLLGLPPSPEEIDHFLNDASSDAYERLVDRLLASPHFGERWGRHWLDAAGYVDTVGADNDAAIILPAEGKWRYRDYVVRSFNEDKPYDRFVTEQLAGDELVDWRQAQSYGPEMLDLLIATGYLRNVADRTAEDELNTADIRYSVLYDTMELVGTNLLGLSLQCARCHSHKYDPIPHRDYYAMMALFTPAYNPQAWLQPHFRGSAKKPVYRELPDVSAAEKQAIDEHNASVDRQVADIAAQVAALEQPYQRQVRDKKLAALPEAVRADTALALDTPADQRSEVQAYLVEKLGPLAAVSAEEISQALSREDSQRRSGLQQQSAAVNATRRAYGHIQALYDVGPPPVTHLLRRGNYQTPGDVVEAGFLTVLAGPTSQPPSFEPISGGASSGRRLALAQWITDPDSPAGGLAARVMVNRVWMHLFGRGLVATPGNFGRSGAAPTHPELLDWLACAFMDGGWRIKPIIKRIMMSEAYRQASQASADQAGGQTAGQAAVEAALIDPANDLLWRMRLRRLESEIVRDVILATSGTLRPDMGGPPLMLDPRPDGMVVIKADTLPHPQARWRRSLYILARRAYHLTLLDVFDQPVVATNCTVRTPSAVVTQSLALLNGAFIFEQAEQFASRVAAHAGGDRGARIDRAFRLAFGRPPNEEEVSMSSQLIDRQAERFSASGETADRAEHRALGALCHMLLNANEFLYIE